MSYLNSSWTGKAPRSLDENCGVRSTHAQIEPMHEDRPPMRLGWWLYALAVIALALAFWADALTPPLQAERLTAQTVADVGAEHAAIVRSVQIAGK